MALHLIPAQLHKSPQSPLPAVPLGSAEMVACLAVYADQNLLVTDREAFVDLANQMRARQQWLACDCTGQMADPPMLFARRTPNGHATLVRMPGRRAHDPTCPFYWEPGQGAPVAQHAEPKGPLVDGGFVILRPVNGTVRSTVDRESVDAGQGGPIIPKLARVLFSILHASTVLRAVNGALLPLPEQYGQLRTVLGTLHLAKGMPDRSLNTVTALHPDQVGSVIERIRAQRWPADVMPQGFLITPVESYSYRQVVAGSVRDPRTIEVLTDVVVPGRGTEGPYLGCFLIGPSDRSHRRFALLRGYVHPMFDRRWLCPVDSSLEREAIKVLRGQQRYWHRGHNLQTWLEKPMFSVMAGEQVIPDFIYTEPTSGRRVFIEVMGSSDPIYLERKRRTHALMGQLAPVVTVSVEDFAAMDRLQKRLSRAVLSEFGL